MVHHHEVLALSTGREHVLVLVRVQLIPIHAVGRTRQTNRNGVTIGMTSVRHDRQTVHPLHAVEVVRVDGPRGQTVLDPLRANVTVPGLGSRVVGLVEEGGLGDGAAVHTRNAVALKRVGVTAEQDGA